MITLELPWPPTANTYYRRVNGRTLISRQGRAYRKAVAKQAMVERWPTFGDARLSVCITAYPPDNRRRDLDNLHKGLIDALESAGLYDDDSQIDHLSIERREAAKPGHVVVSVQERRA